MALTDVRWTRPVKVRLQCGLEHTFTSIYDALDFLENEEGSPRDVDAARRILFLKSLELSPVLLSNKKLSRQLLERPVAPAAGTDPQNPSQPAAATRHLRIVA